MAVKTDYPYSYRIVTLGGGTGHFALINGLKRFNDPNLITAITGVTDSGGSSGLLRSELGVLPPGDTRQCILAFAPDEVQQDLVSLFHYRFPDNTPWGGHNPINIQLAALELMYGPEMAIKVFQKIHNIPGNIIPVSLNKIDLVAKMNDGEEIIGETNIDLRYFKNKKSYDSTKKIEYISLTSTAFSNPNALQAISDADLVIFAPGDLYTSILPHLLVENVARVINQAKAKKIYCGNLMTKPGETDDFKASDFLRELADYLGETSIDLAIFGSNSLSEEVLNYYKNELQYPVEVDLEKCQKLFPKTVIKAVPHLAHYSKSQRVLRHNPELLAETILNGISEITSPDHKLPEVMAFS